MSRTNTDPHSGPAAQPRNPQPITQAGDPVRRVPRARTGAFAALALLSLSTSLAHARLDLSRASVERLDNGLTLILLEDRTFPVASLQMTYGTGAKDDPAGRLGLAHFFEHMAFRGSENFPDTGLVSEIYAAGGEWHGYTWIDSTNYFATVPKEHLPLLLDIEADRMARLEIRKEDVEAERGAVLSEMNGYLNDPDSTLFDALIAAHFLTHPYRNNTIGYAADVSAVTHDDLVAFYKRHYAPQNAVLAIVGDFDRVAVRAAVEKKLGPVKKSVIARDPLTPEIARTGERRIRLSLPAEEKLFKIAYPTPAASSADFAPFLVLQALIGESDGVNFHQNDWGTPVGDDSPIAGVAGNVRTWMIPTAEPYAFVISGSAKPNADDGKIERGFQKAFDRIAAGKIDAAALDRAKEKVATALAFDIETTEDAAHELAYFAAIGAFDRRMSLEGDVQAVTAGQTADIARRYFAADQRTIAWLEPGPPSSPPKAIETSEVVERRGAANDSTPAEEPVGIAIDDKRVVYFRRSALSPIFAVKALVRGRFDCDACAADDIAFNTTTISATAPAAKPEDAFAEIGAALKNAKPSIAAQPSDDPMARLEETFAALSTGGPDAAGPLVATISGDLSQAIAKDLAEKYFVTLPAPASPDQSRNRDAQETGFRRDDRGTEIEITIRERKAQAAVGYIVAAPGVHEAFATRLALYVLSHGYEGRLGKEAISRRGLLYYIDAQYRGASGPGVVTLAAGVDPDKVDAFRAVLKAELARLVSNPPSDDEIAEAKRHLYGRKISAVQSNEELAEAMLRDFLAVGAPESAADFKKRLDAVPNADVQRAAAALAGGAVVTIRVGGVD